MKFLFLLVLVVLLLAGVPVAYCVGFAAVIGMISNGGIHLMNISQATINGVNNFTLLAVPLFLLAGKLMNTGGVTRRLFRFAGMLVGWLPGGLGHVNVLCSVIFAGMSGSAVADAGGLGAIELEAQRNAGYDDEFSVGVTAASSLLGPLIPPSVPLILFGMMSGASVGSLFIAGIVPGIVLALSFMLLVSWMAHKRHYPREAFPGLREAVKISLDAILPLMAVVIILAGRFSGFFTTTECAAVVVVYSMILCMFIYREVNLRKLHELLIETVKDTVTVSIIVAFAALLGTVLVRSMLPQQIAKLMGGIVTNRYMFLIILNIFLLFVGMFMESTSCVTILVPILLPLALQWGVTPIQLGIIFVVNLGVGVMSPPFGILIFVMSKVAGMDSMRVAKSFIPWILVTIIVVFIISFIPQLTLWLPSLMGLSVN
ncbi:MAG: TRAP transporter large permease [Lachnospiraceae bacterium]|nr:TRAP transporter large permease [Lachnospiraceae bacterium]